MSSFVKDFLAGGIASSVAETIMAPLERTKLILQVQHSSQQIRQEDRYKGIMDCLTRIPREQGFTSFWRGNSINIMRAFPLQAFNFAFKDHLRPLFLQGVNDKTQFWRFMLGNLAAGGTAGVISLTIVYPLDFCKTRIAADVGCKVETENCPSGKNKKVRQYKGVRDCLRKTIKTDGITGIYKGYRLSIVGIAVYRSFYYGMYDTAKESFFDDPEDIPLYLKWIMAQSAVAVAGIISYPFDTVRRRMMMQAGKPRSERPYTTAVGCLKYIIREEGVRSFYRGAFVNLFRSTGGAIVLLLYDELKHIMSQW